MGRVAILKAGPDGVSREPVLMIASEEERAWDARAAMRTHFQRCAAIGGSSSTERLASENYSWPANSFEHQAIRG
jgi:hypothetical protein